MSSAPDRQELEKYVDRSVGPGPLASRVVAVMERLPHGVSAEFLGDPRFRLALDDLAPRRGRTVWIASPGREGGSRCVVLKPLLAECAEDFAHYIIAHELAHAHLRNGGWEEIDDPEAAADALATCWGFSRPSRSSARPPILGLGG